MSSTRAAKGNRMDVAFSAKDNAGTWFPHTSLRSGNATAPALCRHSSLNCQDKRDRFSCIMGQSDVQR